MKKIRELLYVLLLVFMITGLFTNVIPESSFVTEVQASTKPAAPKLVSATPGTSEIVLKWKVAEGAKGYRVYRKTADTKWKALKTITNSATVSYTDTTCEKGVVYTYTVRAYKKESGKTVWGSYKRSGISTVLLPIPQTVKAEVTSMSSVKFSWNPVNNADGYYVYRKINNSSWKKVSEVTAADASVYEDKDVTAGKVYRYTVKAYKSVNGKRILSKYQTKGKSVTMRPPTVKLLSAKADASYDVTVEWEKTEGVTGYRVYRKLSAGASWTALKTIRSADICTYTDTTAEVGGTYIYTVRAYKKQDGKNVWGTYDKTGKTVNISLDAPELVSANTAGTSSIVLVWKPVENADGYRVYVREDGWKRLATLSGGDIQMHTLTGLAADKTYNFTVRAYKNINGSKVWGKYSTSGINGATERGELKLSAEKLYIHEGFYSKELKFEGTSQNPQWISSNSEIVSVDANGRLRGESVGTAVITALFEGVEYKCTVVVEHPSIKAENKIIELGESTYINVTGTEREVEWSLMENQYLDIELVNNKQLKVTGKSLGRYQLKAQIGDIVYYPMVVVKGEINIPQTKVEIEVGEKAEIIISTTYATIEEYMDSPYIAEEKLTHIGGDSWKLEILGTTEGTTTINICDPDHTEELQEKIQVTVVDNGSVVTKNFKLQRTITSTGTYSDGWYVIGFSGYYEDVPGVLYTWSVSYNQTSDEYEYGVALTSDEEMLVMALTGNPAKSSAMKAEYMYFSETTGGAFVAESSLNINTYSGQNLTFKVTESEDMAAADLNELMSIANDTLILGFEGWQTYVLEERGFDLQSLGFRAYPKQ